MTVKLEILAVLGRSKSDLCWMLSFPVALAILFAGYYLYLPTLSPEVQREINFGVPGAFVGSFGGLFLLWAFRISWTAGAKILARARATV